MAIHLNCTSIAPVGAWIRSRPSGTCTTGRSLSGMSTNLRRVDAAQLVQPDAVRVGDLVGVRPQLQPGATPHDDRRDDVARSCRRSRPADRSPRPVAAARPAPRRARAAPSARPSRPGRPAHPAAPTEPRGGSSEWRGGTAGMPRHPPRRPSDASKPVTSPGTADMSSTVTTYGSSRSESGSLSTTTMATAARLRSSWRDRPNRVCGQVGGHRRPQLVSQFDHR